MATVVEKVVAALRERPMTRAELSIMIDDVSSRAILYQLTRLLKRGFIRITQDASRVYILVSEDGLWGECGVCQRTRPCWALEEGICNYCRNSPRVGNRRKSKAKPARKKPELGGLSRSRMYTRDDAHSKAYQSLLRGERIGEGKSWQG